MKSDYLRNKTGRNLLALSFIAGIGLVSSTAVQAQWNRDRDRDRVREGQPLGPRRRRPPRDGIHRRREPRGRHRGVEGGGSPRRPAAGPVTPKEGELA